MSEYYVDEAEFIVKIPQGLKEVGVLLEPTTVVESLLRSGRIIGVRNTGSSWGKPLCSEISDGDAPHTPRGCVAQAWSVSRALTRRR